MDENPYKDNLSRFCVTFVRSLIAWNRAEDSARSILKSLAKGGLGMMAAVAHLGSNGLRDAILTVAEHWDDDETPHLKEISKHVKHFVTGLDLIRGYRNFYVHSIKAMGVDPENEKSFLGFLTATEARGRYAWVQQNVSTVELEAFMAHCMRLQQYGDDIAASLSEAPNALAALAGTAKRTKPLSSLEMPTWPDTVTKARQFLVERPAPAVSNRAK